MILHVHTHTRSHTLQECYNLLQKHQIAVAQEDIERVDTLRYMWEKLHQQVSELQSTLLEVQPQFRASLLDNVQVYMEQVNSFVANYSSVR